MLILIFIFDVSSDPKNTSQHVLDLTKCVNDETMINIDHSSVITNKSINNER